MIWKDEKNAENEITKILEQYGHILDKVIIGYKNKYLCEMHITAKCYNYDLINSQFIPIDKKYYKEIYDKIKECLLKNNFESLNLFVGDITFGNSTLIMTNINSDLKPIIKKEDK